MLQGCLVGAIAQVIYGPVLLYEVGSLVNMKYQSPFFILLLT